MPTELGLWQAELEGGEGAVTEERVSNLGKLPWEWTRGPSDIRQFSVRYEYIILARPAKARR